MISRAIWEGLAKGELERITEFYDANVELDYTASGAPDLGVYRGTEAGVKAAMQWSGRFESYSTRAEELIDVPPDRVIARVREAGVGAASGAPVELQMWQVGTFRDGKVVRVQFFRDEEDALRAAGLR